MEEVNKNTELNDTDKKLHISDVMCWFGLHKWNYKSDNGIERKCKRCAKQQKRTVLLKGTGSDFDNVERWKTNT
jgi:trehalose utilization protein